MMKMSYNTFYKIYFTLLSLEAITLIIRLSVVSKPAVAISNIMLVYSSIAFFTFIILGVLTLLFKKNKNV